jgi:HEAT repeat protein
MVMILMIPGARAELSEAPPSQPSASPESSIEGNGSNPTIAIPALVEGLKSNEVSIRRNAAFMLGEMGQDARKAMGPVAEALKKDPDSEVRRNAAFALGEIGVPAIPVLMDCLNDKDARVRRNVSAALVRIGTPAVPYLMRALDSPNPIIRRNAAGMLGRIGPNAHKAIPALERYLDDSDKAFCWTVKQALRSIKNLPPEEPPAGPHDKGPALLASAPTTPEVPVDNATGDLPGLMLRLSDAQPAVRKEAAFALARIGERALPPLIKALGSEQVVMRRNAAFSLGEMGAKAAPAVPALEQLLNDPVQNVRWCADIAIKKILAAEQ